MTGVLHFADTADGITAVGTRPQPSLCGEGEDGDGITFVASNTTCPDCLAAMHPEEES